MEFNEKDIIKNLKIDAKAVGIPSGAAEMFIDNVISNVKKQLKKYHADFAYVYENRDKIL